MSRRKRSVSALLSNDEKSITARSSHKSRAISRVIDEESEESTLIIHTHDRRMVPCNCSKCNRKIVDVRTKLNHKADRDSDDDQDSEVVHHHLKIMLKRNSTNGNGDLSTDLLRRQQEIPLELFITDEKSSETDEESNESEINNGDNNDYEYTEIFENYAPPVYEQFQNRISPDTNANRQFLWILLWIMSFRKRFNIPEIATEVLIQFIKLLLIEISGSNFEEFSGSLYLARNILGLKDQHHNFAKVEEFQQNGNLIVMKCSHVKFSNSTSRRLKQYQTPLAKRSTLLYDRIKI
ncbi:hypothetical protein RirG_113440 [Rhizophagus irregularis DAOM 197198w]|uniref:Transposase domain-containing protein n=1 Tax=Rhizophagus irregularis (strain DAOM 197198w) TaxID=1432141 RepID=A0A015ML20_RHIIW|nr:hypothetical protein RirG_113440 [Rhizophagus irregularis DAOM 197198w]